jgi:propanol-preferring alcohol dehydrogenase
MMLAARLHGPNQVVVEEVPEPAPDAGEVIVEVAAAGICGSDLHVIGGVPILPSYPRILGHEMAGTVVQLGASVEPDWLGCRVCVHFLVTCGECRMCREGRDSLCFSRESLGRLRDGGFAELLRVPARNLIPLPDNVGFEAAALATDAFATPYHAIMRRSSVRIGAGVIIIGAGGLGSAAVQLSRLAGADPVVVLDTDPRSVARAQALGADIAIDPSSAEFADWARSEAGEFSRFSTCLDFVGLPETTRLASTLVERGGRVVVVGGHGENVTISVARMELGRQEREIVGSYAFTREDIAATVRLLSAGKLSGESLITHRVELRDINAGIEALRDRRDGPGRVVVSIGK